MTEKGPDHRHHTKPKGAPILKAAPRIAPKRPASSPVVRKKFSKKFDLTKGPKSRLSHKPGGFHKDRLYRREYSKLIWQTKVVDGLRLTPLADLLKNGEVVVVTTQGEKFGLLPLTNSSPHIRPYALAVMRSIAKEFYEKSGGYQLLVSSLFRTPTQQNKLSGENRTAIKRSDGDSTHFFGNTFDFTTQRFLSPDGKQTIGNATLNASLTRILDRILIDHQRRGMAMGYWEKIARHVIAAKSVQTPTIAKAPTPKQAPAPKPAPTIAGAPAPKPASTIARPPTPKPVPAPAPNIAPSIALPKDPTKVLSGATPKLSTVSKPAPVLKPVPTPKPTPPPKPALPTTPPESIETQKTVELPIITRENALGRVSINVEASSPKWEADGWKVEPFLTPNGERGVRLKKGNKTATIYNLKVSPGITKLTLELK